VKFLVTGVNGFIGSNLTRHLLNKGHQVRGLILPGTDETFLEGLEVEKVYGDLTKPETLTGIVEGVDVVIHLAAKVAEWGPEESFKILNFEATQTMLDLAITNGVKRFVYMSSLTVHGLKNFDNATEDTPYEPCNYYALYKKKSEDLLNEYHSKKKIEVVIIRPGFVIFGPNDRMFSLEVYQRYAKKNGMPVINKGKALTCYSYVENLVDGLILVSEHPKAAGNTYILSDGPNISWKEFNNEMFRPLGKEIKLSSVPYWLAYLGAGLMEGIYKLFRRKSPPLITLYMIKVQSRDLSFSNQKIMQELGYEPKISIQEGFLRTYEWFLQVAKDGE